MTTQEEAQATLDLLTPQQKTILALSSVGLSAKEVGGRLGLSVTTVKTHTYLAFKRIGIKKVTQAAVLCALAGEVKDWRVQA